jgi:ribonuclease Z
MVARPIAMPTEAQPHTAVLLDDGRMRITAIETNHAPVKPAYAYRFDYRGRSVVITGDTTAWAPLVEASRGADVMVSEAMNREMVAALQKVTGETGRPRVSHIMHDIQSYHLSPTEAATMANAAGVKLLVFYHLLPAPDNAVLRTVFTRGVDEVRKGRWDLSSDGSLYTLPVGSTDVLVGRVAY